MKTHLTIIIFLFCCSLCFTTVTVKAQNIQTLINKMWEAQTGNPDTIDYAATTIDNHKHSIICGNTLNGLFSDVLLAKYDGDGNLLWQITYDNNGYSDYGTAVTVDANDTIYIAGTVIHTLSQGFDFLVQKYDPNGTLIWTQTYNSNSDSTDAATAILLGDSGFVYVTGTSYNDTTKYDYRTMKLNPFTGGIVWNKKFDAQNLNDVPVDLIWSHHYLFVTGAAQFAATNFHYFTVKYNSVSGSYVIGRGDSIVSNGFDHVNAFAKDNQQNIYITGRAFNGTDYDIYTIKMDTGFNTIWEATYDGGYSDEANDIKIDVFGNVYVCGSAVDSNSHKDGILISYDQDGSELWNRIFYSASGQGDFVLEKVAIKGLGQAIFVAGTNDMGGSKSVESIMCDLSGNVIGEKLQEGTADARVNSVKSISDTLYVISTFELNGGSRTYDILKYAIGRHEIAVVTDTSGKALWMQSRVLIQFEPTAVDRELLNDRAFKFGKPSEILTSAAVTELENALPFSLSNCTLVKLTSFTPSDSISLTRTGNEIKIPAFYAAFALDYPYYEGANEFQIAQMVESCTDAVVYSHPDYVGKLDAVPSDPYYASNQSSFHPTGTFPIGNIDIESAWNYQTGKSYIKIGVIDDGIDYHHADLGGPPGSPNQKILGGYDYTTGSSLFTSTPTSVHGTKVSGIIGALRNNQIGTNYIGIAGISGGDMNVGNKGCPLYGFNIITSDSLAFVSNAFAAITENATDNGNFVGMNIMNNSWGISPGDPLSIYNDTAIYLLKDAVHYASRNGVIFVASRGNDATADLIHYPANFQNSWIMSVGASGTDGNLARIDSGNADFNSAYGDWMDFLAPGAKENVYTTTTGGYFFGFDGTSGSAPHATGLAALMLSEYNDSAIIVANLAPEDVENCMEIGTKPDTIDNYDEQGSGMINGDSLFKYIWTPKHDIIHFLNYGVDSVTLTNYHVLLNLSRKAYNIDSVQFVKGNYLVDVYRLDYSRNINVPTNKSIIATWPIPSKSEIYPPLGTLGAANEIVPYEEMNCCQVSYNFAFNEDLYGTGETYHLFDTLGNDRGWFPYDTIYALNSAIIYYGVLTNDHNISDIEESVSDSLVGVILYPNPSESFNRLLITSKKEIDAEIDLYDVMGRKINSVFSGKLNEGYNTFNVKLDELAGGIYFYKVHTKENNLMIKFIKV